MIPGAPFDAGMAGGPDGAESWWLTAADGARLRAVAWPGGGRGTALIFPGRTEVAEKYGRVAGELVARGLAAVVIDWRGQGLSDRHPGDAMLGHVADFADYQRDVAALVGFADGLGLPEPRYLFAHSMGGCIGLRTLVERDGFAGAVFSAPMWGLHLGAAARTLAAALTAVAGRAGLGERPMPGAGGRGSFERNVLTSDPVAYAWSGALAAAHPELTLGPPSIGWTGTAIRETARLAAGPMPETPQLVLLGSDERVVSPAAIRAAAGRMPGCRLVELAGGRHELFMEGPEIRAEIWRQVDAFLEAVPARRRLAAASGA
jgi:lysophospholipase